MADEKRATDIDLRALRREIGAPGRQGELEWKRGDKVSVFNRKKGRWFDDGTILEVLQDGRFKVSYKRGKKTKLAAPESIRPVPVAEYNPDVNPLDSEVTFDPYQNEGLPSRRVAGDNKGHTLGGGDDVDVKMNSSFREGKQDRQRPKFEKEMKSLESMGFLNRRANSSILEAVNGDIEKAITILVETQSSSAETNGGDKEKQASEEIHSDGDGYHHDFKPRQTHKREREVASPQAKDIDGLVKDIYEHQKPIISTPSHLAIWGCKAVLVSLGFRSIFEDEHNAPYDTALESEVQCFGLAEIFPIRTIVSFIKICDTIALSASLCRPKLISHETKNAEELSEWVETDADGRQITEEAETDEDGRLIMENLQFPLHDLVAAATEKGLQIFLDANNKNVHIPGLCGFLAKEGLEKFRERAANLRNGLLSRGVQYLRLHFDASRLMESYIGTYYEGVSSHSSSVEDRLACALHAIFAMEGFSPLADITKTQPGTRNWKRVDSNGRLEAFRIRYKHVSGKHVEMVIIPFEQSLIVTVVKIPAERGTPFHIRLPTGLYTSESGKLLRTASLLSRVREELVLPLLRESDAFRVHWLPRHLLYTIAQFLDYREICRMSCTSRYVSQVMASQALWRTLVTRAFSNDEIQNTLQYLCIVKWKV